MAATTNLDNATLEALYRKNADTCHMLSRAREWPGLPHSRRTLSHAELFICAFIGFACVLFVFQRERKRDAVRFFALTVMPN